MNSVRITLAAIFAVAGIGVVASVTAPDEASAHRRSVITPATFSAAKFCDRKPDADIPYSLMTQCTRLALTPEFQTPSTGFPDGRVLVNECISEAYAPDSGHRRSLADRQAFIAECFRFAGR